MSIPPIAKATLQAAVINAGSNVLAQGIKAYRDKVRGWPFIYLFHGAHRMACGLICLKKRVAGVTM